MRIKEINIFTPSEDRGYLGCFLTLSDCMAEYPRPRRGYQFANLETRSIWVYDGVAWSNSNRQLPPMSVIGNTAQSGDIVNNEPSAYYYVDNSGLEQTIEFVFNNTTTGLEESITVQSSGYTMVFIWWTGKTLEYKKIDIPSDERMSHLVRGTIDIGSYQYNVLDEYNSQEKKGLYVIKTSLGFGGHMLVTGDDMGHVIHQFIFSDYSLNSSGDIISHKDERPSVIFRTYNIGGGTSSIPVGTWGRWYDLSEFIISEIPNASKQKSGLMSSEDKNKLDMSDTAHFSLMNKIQTDDDALDGIIYRIVWGGNAGDSFYYHIHYIDNKGEVKDGIKNILVPNASKDTKGFMSSEDKIALDALKVRVGILEDGDVDGLYGMANMDGLMFDGVVDGIKVIAESVTKFDAVYYNYTGKQFVCLNNGKFYNNWIPYNGYFEGDQYNEWVGSGETVAKKKRLFCTSTGAYYFNGDGLVKAILTDCTTSAKVNFAIKDLWIDDNENRPYISRLLRGKLYNGKYRTQLTICQIDGTIDCEYMFDSTSKTYIPPSMVKLSPMDGGKSGYAVVDWDIVDNNYFVNDDSGKALLYNSSMNDFNVALHASIYAYMLHNGEIVNAMSDFSE